MKKKTKKLFAALLTLAAALAVVLIVQFSTDTVNSDLSIAKRNGYKPLYVAHRGLSCIEPQNSVPAFEAAKSTGYDAFEFDIHTTSDGKWVVIHNDTVDDMTDATGAVDSFTYDDIRKLRLDKGNGIKKYDDLKIPSLEEALCVCDGSDMIPVIEIKKCDTQYLSDFLKALEEHGLTDRAVVISFDFDYLKAVRELDPDIQMMYLVKAVKKADVDKCIENGNIGIDFKYSRFISSMGALKYAKENGLRLGAWTVDNTIAFDLMSMFEIDIITTNRIIP